tara:strand:- start:2076 stop:2486 length:411 start_codon:yes stop_codon:yes gene_type:complete
LKKSELKNILKPLVKECIKECLYEEGVLSSIVSEVVRGMGTNIIKEEMAPTPRKSNPVRQQPSKSEALREHKQKLLDAIGNDAYGGVDLFEGTTPASPDRSPEMSSPLGDTDPSDPGVDISGIVALGGKKWKAFMG